MIIYDTKQNYNNQIKGMLYLSMIDVDYLVSKYSSEDLRKFISQDYLEVFLDELYLISHLKKLSPQYYSVLTLEVVTIEDENLLYILKEEVKNGNMFTRKQLMEISQEEIEKKLKKFNLNDLDNMSLEEIYKLRSYRMSKYIYENIAKVNKCEEIMRKEETGYGVRKVYRYKLAESDYRTIRKNMELLGVASDIYESDYFEPRKAQVKELKLVNKKID